MQYDSIVIKWVQATQRDEEVKVRACLLSVGRFLGAGALIAQSEEEFTQYTGHHIMGEKRNPWGLLIPSRQ